MKNGCNLGLGDSDGMTPAHAAAHCNHLPILHFLHSSGAPMHVTKNDGHKLTDLAKEALRTTMLLNEAMPTHVSKGVCLTAWNTTTGRRQKIHLAEIHWGLPSKLQAGGCDDDNIIDGDESGRRAKQRAALQR